MSNGAVNLVLELDDLNSVQTLRWNYEGERVEDWEVEEAESIAIVE